LTIDENYRSDGSIERIDKKKKKKKKKNEDARYDRSIPQVDQSTRALTSAKRVSSSSSSFFYTGRLKHR